MEIRGECRKAFSFFVNLSKSSKRIEVPEKEWYPKEKSRRGG